MASQSTNPCGDQPASKKDLFVCGNAVKRLEHHERQNTLPNVLGFGLHDSHIPGVHSAPLQRLPQSHRSRSPQRTYLKTSKNCAAHQELTDRRRRGLDIFGPGWCYRLRLIPLKRFANELPMEFWPRANTSEVRKRRYASHHRNASQAGQRPATLDERRNHFRKAQVVGSIPSVGSDFHRFEQILPRFM